MQVKGCTALVTGTNRGIGQAFVQALLDAGAARVYAASRTGEGLPPAAGNLVPLRIDVTDEASIAAAAAKARDVTLLINNAGVNTNTGLLHAPSLEGARNEMEVNYFGTLRMCRAFAPILKANGGGAIVNMISIVALAHLPMMGSLSASKAALWSLTQGVRAELKSQGTAVTGVFPGAVDTRMTEGVPVPKITPAEAARGALDAVESGTEEIYPSQMAEGWFARFRADPKALERELSAYLPR
jgi:NAD(P)-dependent dehydrogenase (short-subunit alcohol dehydrogenase family)